MFFPSRGSIESLKIKFSQFNVTGIKYYIVMENSDFSFVEIDNKLLVYYDWNKYFKWIDFYKTNIF